MCEWWLFCHQKSCLAPEFLFVSRRLGSVLERWSLWAACQWVGKWWRWAGDGGRFLPQNLRWLVVEVTNPRSPRGGCGFCGFWDQILRGKVFFFSKPNWTFQDNPWFSRKNRGKAWKWGLFQKQNKFSYPHEAGKKGRDSPKNSLPGQACRVVFCEIIDLSTFHKTSFWVSRKKVQ